MDKGDCFLMGSPGRNTKHLWIVISDTKKHGGEGVIVNLTTNKHRCNGECLVEKKDHPWLTEAESWACFGDALLMDAKGWAHIDAAILAGFIVVETKMADACVGRIVAAAKISKALPARLLPY